jgi:hypothetical protein
MFEYANAAFGLPRNPGRIRADELLKTSVAGYKPDWSMVGRQLYANTPFRLRPLLPSIKREHSCPHLSRRVRDW